MTKGVVAPHEVYAPLSCSVSTARKVRAPSLVQPERSFRSTGWRVGEASISSSRV